ncbi:MAG TPA: hypothetical protein VKD72_03230 [Gemmataceae bacterium]|nr:hypothetical protein [Gemmataceae bacterium]
MKEADWLDWVDPRPMLRFLRLRASDRKLRLFACACCRLVWDHLPGDHVRRTVELGERYAEGLVLEVEMETARREFNKAIARERGVNARLAQAVAELLRARFSPALVAERARTGREAFLLQWRQCDLLRDLFRPFRRVGGEPPWLAWKDGLVVKKALAIYEQRRWQDMPLLADLLAEAGCADDEVLSHCRGQGPQVRGCWVLDELLGRE